MARRRNRTRNLEARSYLQGVGNSNRAEQAGSSRANGEDEAAGTPDNWGQDGKKRGNWQRKYVDNVRNTGQGENLERQGNYNSSYLSTADEADVSMTAVEQMGGDVGDLGDTGGIEDEVGNQDSGLQKHQRRELDPVEFQARVFKAYEAAEVYVDTTIAPSRIQAAEYYKGAPFGDEEDGRSQVVLTEVRDTVLSILPPLLRIFASGDKVVEYLPRNTGDIAAAEQAADAINFIFQDMNPGFEILHAAFKDALTKKLGVVTWWAEEEERVIERSFSGLAEEELLLFQQQHPEVEFLSITRENTQGPAPTYKAQVRLTDKQRKYRVRALPPECFVIDRRARDTDKFFDCIGFRDMVTVSELVQMGFDEDEIREHGAPGQDETWYWNYEEVERNPGFAWPEYPPDPAMLRVKYIRLYMRIDKDGDGVAELRCIHAIGRGCYVLRDEVVDHAPFALFCPDPEPHAIFGHSIADATMDLQRIKSHVVRATLDSLAQSIFPRTAVVEGQVNIDDVLNKEVGAIIRMRQIGAVQDLSTPFVGQAAMPILEYLDEIKAQRTGVTPTSQGLDADLLQSTTKAAVTAQISAAQERIEVIARIFAETGMKKLFTGLLKLVCRHQDKPLVMKLRGQWTQIDPTVWDENMECTISVGLGRGDDAQQMNFLGQIAQKQEQILQTMGQNNPLVKLHQYQQTLSQLVRKAGYKNPDSFFSPISEQQEQALAMAEQQAKASQIDPNILLAKVEMAKTQAEAFAKLEAQAIARAKLQLDADQERDKLEADIILKAADLAGKYGQAIDWEAIIQFIQRPRPDVLQLTEALIQNEKAVNAQILSQIGMASNQPGVPGMPGVQSTTPQPNGPQQPTPAAQQMAGQKPS